jgi:hypothetical protein
VLDKTVTLWICIQQCCIIYLYVWIYTRRPLVYRYILAVIVWIRVEMSFLLIFFFRLLFSLCVWTGNAPIW